MTDALPIEVTVVIPCLNEERTVGACVLSAFEGLEAAGVVGEVVVVDNGSTDRSIEFAEQQGAQVVHAKIKGYGSAIKTGILYAQGEFIVTGDGDGSHDFRELPNFIKKWRDGYDFVLGSRIQGEIKNSAMRWHHRYIGTPILSFLVNLFFGVGTTDLNSGMRGITRKTAERLDLRTNGFELCSESLIKAAKVGIKITEIPITTWPEGRNRPPHLHTFRDGWRHLRFIFLSAPNWLFLLPGGLLMGLGLGFVLWLLPGPVSAGNFQLNTNTISLAMMVILLGMHIFSTGLFVKVFCHTEKLSRGQPTFARWLKRLKLEHALFVGGVLLALGLGGDGIIFGRWAAHGFGRLDAVRAVFFCSLSLFAGVEVLFSSVFLSMLGIQRDTYIGE